MSSRVRNVHDDELQHFCDWQQCYGLKSPAVVCWATKWGDFFACDKHRAFDPEDQNSGPEDT